MDAVTSPPVAVAPPRWRRRLRNTLLVLVALIAAFVAFGYLALPAIVKSQLESRLQEKLGRKATVGKVEFDPFTLQATLTDFTLADRAPGKPLLAFDTLALDVSAASLWRRAPVFDAVRLTRPRVALTRNADGSYSIQDLIDMIAAAPPGPPPAFSVNNIEIDDGALTLDDKPHGRVHEITGVGIGVPFLSSLPYAAQIRVTPKLAGTVNGTAFALGGTSSSPFADVKEASLDVNLDALPLARYVEYAPLPIAAKVKDGALTTRLKIAFVTEKDVPKTLKVSGTARVDRLALTRNDGTPLVSAAAIETTLGELDALGRTVAIERLAVDAPNVDLRRLADGALEFVRLMTPPSAPAARAAVAASAAKPWAIRIADARIGNGTLALSDASIDPPFAATLTGVSLAAKGVSTADGPPAKVEVAFDSDGARFDGNGELDVPRLAGRGHFALSKFSLARLYPYYAAALALDVKRGSVALAGDFDIAAGATPLQVKLAGGTATLTDVELALSDEHEPLWRIPSLAFAGIEFDLAQHRVAIDSVDGPRAAMRVVREADGTINFARFVRTTAQTGANGAAAASGDATWAYAIRRITLERSTADVEDRGVRPPVKLRLTEVRAVAQNFGNARGAKGALDFRARTGSDGRIALAGSLATNPFAGDWRVDASGVDLMPLRAYVESQTNIVFTGGALATKGRLVLDAGAAGGPRATYAGDVTISDFGALDRPTNQELVRWKTLTLTGVDTASAPVHVAIGAVALDDFFARIIVNPDATLNLQKLLAAPDAVTAPAMPGAAATAQPPPPAQRAAARPGASRATAAPANASGSSAAAKLAEVAAPLAASADLPVTIGRIEVSRGNVRFSDFFVKPNYTANLTNVAGSVSALSATQAGDVSLDAKVEHLAPVEVRGKVNPFARELSLDLTGKARDVDLPPLTPYAAKYAGYGIEKGKLSFDVHYKIEERKLTADNKLILDQLTFGARVDSPDATKLPVQLAVALLKDRNGVIDIELPISGSLDDPQFSIGGLIIRVIVNLITKVVTAPFALLGALAGGGEQLAFVEFAPGRAQVTPAAETKLKTLSKALGDRPNLKLDVTGRAIPDTDRDGLKRSRLDAAVRAQKQKATPGATSVEAAEYPKLLTAVYDDAKLPDKPKNALGFAKEIPVPEMEALLLESFSVDDEALNALANERAQTVKVWLTDQGGVSAERVFLVASKLSADGVKDGGAPTRVDFALK